MSLPSKAIDRLFERLAATYGQEFSRKFDGVNLSAVKSSWAHELSGFDSQLEAVAWALENLPERAPNVIEFRNLCRKAPAQDVPRLPEPKADPERVKTELSKLTPIREAAIKSGESYDPKAWARQIMARYVACERINPTTLRFAREALKGQL